ncbi:hypothetical protein EMCRGX_G001578 [Ephydatia muelleri]
MSCPWLTCGSGGRTEEEMIMVDMLENEAMDLRNGFVLDFCYNPNMEAMKPDYLKLAKSRLQKLASVLGNKPWFVGDEITFPDFLLYERLEQHRLFDPSLFNDFPNLLLAQPIRLLLKFTGTDFEDVRYELGPAPDYSRDQWFAVKETLGYDFPNLATARLTNHFVPQLPYYSDGKVKLTQSGAILRYIAKVNGLSGADDTEAAVIDMLANEVADLKQAFTGLVYNPNMESLKADWLVGVKPKLQRFSKYLGTRSWLVGEKISYADFLFYETLEGHRSFQPALLDDYPNLKEYISRFESLPAISAYLKSSDYIAYPWYGPVAAWGGK